MSVLKDMTLPVQILLANYFMLKFASEMLVSESTLVSGYYTIPTLTTGIVRKFKAMIIGGFICYTCFIISCFTDYKIDMLLQSIAAISAWLIPGLILRQRYIKSTKKHV